MLRHLAALLASTIICVLVPSAASAAVTASVEGTTIVVTGSGDNDYLNLTSDGFSVSVTTMAFGGEAGPGCSKDFLDLFAPVKCARKDITKIVVNLNAGDDQLVDQTDLPIEADGGDGRDQLLIIFTGVKNNSLSGGAGDDSVRPGRGADDIHGGPGADSVAYIDAPTGVTVTLDDQPNDGGAAEGDNVHSDVENAGGGPGDDHLEGTDGANRLDGGLGGADVLDGGGGADILIGFTGDDTIRAEDGAVDTVDCGEGTDTIQADPNDSLTACESVSSTDADGDGSTKFVDCDDSNASRHPGGVEVGGNGIDEDCDGADAAAPPPPAPQALAVTIASKFKLGLRTVVQQLAVKGASSSASISVSCTRKANGCPFKSKKGGASLAKLFKRAKLKPGAVLEVRVTQPGAIGKVFRFTIRKKKAPKQQTLCLAPGAKAPSACS